MTKLLCSLFLFLLTSVVSSSALQSREVQLLDDDWRFDLGDNPQANARDFADGKWRVVDLPHDWSIEGTTSADAPSGGDGGYFPTGIAWYRRELTADPAWRNKRVWLDFEGVATTCEVWLNGKKLGGHHYAYTPFRFDISEKLDFDKPNVISVRVDNSQQPNSRWYTGSGIYRHVWFTVMEPVSINDVKISTLSIVPTNATVEVSAVITNSHDDSFDATVQIELFDSNADSFVVLDDTKAVATGQHFEIKHRVRVPNPQLWSPETPKLYVAAVRLLEEGQILDEVRVPFGMRTVEISADKGFLLNGESLELCGACVHHDNGPLGAAAFDRAEERRVELLKTAGFNAIRTSHNPPSTAFLNACDRLGMLVIDEAFDGWAEPKKKHDYSTVFQNEWHNDLRGMFRRDGNHPSVVMWSIGNEVYERGNEKGQELARRLAKNTRTFGFGKPVTIALNGLGKDEDWKKLDPMFAAVDVAGYNYEILQHGKDHQRVPGRVIYSSESYPRSAFEGWEATQNNPYVIGDFVWSGIDYLGEAGIGRIYAASETPRDHWEGSHFPWHGGTCGDLDITGWRKPLSHYRQIVWDAGETLYVAVEIPSPDGKPWQLSKWALSPLLPSWTWPGHETKPLNIEVFSRHESVRLYLNDKLVGEQLTGREQEFRAKFEIPYATGELKAVGIDEGKETETVRLTTAGTPARLRLTPDRAAIRADGQDLSFVTVEVVDEAGNWCPLAENVIEYKLDGAASIAAVGNSDLSSRESYQANPRKAFQGRALVVVRSSRSPGTLTFAAQSPGLEPASVKIESREVVESSD